MSYISREAAKVKIWKCPETMLPTQEAEDYLIEQIDSISPAKVRPMKEGEWIVRQRHEHYPSGRPYEELICPFCKRIDHNGDGRFCGYCGAKMGGTDGRQE